MKKWMVLAVVICTGIFFMTQEQRFAYQQLPQRSFSKDRASGEDEGRRLEVSFAYERQNVLGSNQIAVWIEDMEGNYIKTVCVTSYTAADGWRLRKTSLPEWRKAADPAGMNHSEIDAVTGATPVDNGEYKVIWDFTDDNGYPVPDGIYRCFLEGTLYFYDHVIYCGEIDTETGEMEVYPEAEYTNAASMYSGMIGEVKMNYVFMQEEGRKE